MPQQQDI